MQAQINHYPYPILSHPFPSFPFFMLPDGQMMCQGDVFANKWHSLVLLRLNNFRMRDNGKAESQNRNNGQSLSWASDERGSVLSAAWILLANQYREL
jgi:hypothetical protein